MRGLAVSVLCVGLLSLAACSSDDGGGGGGGEAVDPAPTAPVLPDDTESSSPESSPTGFSSCEQITLGIDAFNLGDYDETVARFEAAVPLAEDDLEAAPDSEVAQEMLDAVRYYADLAPEDYLEASGSSPEFLRYKDVTLTECAYGGPPPGSDTDTEPPLTA